MERRGFNLVTLIVGCVFLPVIGCREQAKVAEKPQVLVVSPEKVKAPEANETAADGPKIMFEKVVHDFGQVGPRTKNTCEFNFTNAGKGVLKITNVEYCCGVVTKLRSNKKEYATGESGTLEVEWPVGQQPGMVRKQIFVNSNDQTNPRFGLTIITRIVPKVDYEPKTLNLVLKGDANCPSITLTGLDGKPFSIKQFKSTGDCITADIDYSVEATKFVLQPKIDTERLRKGLNGVIEISLTHPECDTVAIPFNALPTLEIKPPVIIAFNAEPQKPIERDLWILNNYGEDFEIESTASQNKYIAVSSQQKIHNGYQLKLAITPPEALANQRTFTDVFSVNIKGGEKLTVTCRGFYSTKPAKP